MRREGNEEGEDGTKGKQERKEKGRETKEEEEQAKKKTSEALTDLYSREEYEEPNFFLQNKENKTEQKHKR
jgi:hypothetical protein